MWLNFKETSSQIHNPNHPTSFWAWVCNQIRPSVWTPRVQINSGQALLIPSVSKSSASLQTLRPNRAKAAHWFPQWRWYPSLLTWNWNRNIYIYIYIHCLCAHKKVIINNILKYLKKIIYFCIKSMCVCMCIYNKTRNFIHTILMKY